MTRGQLSPATLQGLGRGLDHPGDAMELRSHAGQVSVHLYLSKALAFY